MSNIKKLFAIQGCTSMEKSFEYVAVISKFIET